MRTVKIPGKMGLKKYDCKDVHFFFGCCRCFFQLYYQKWATVARYGRFQGVIGRASFSASCHAKTNGLILSFVSKLIYESVGSTFCLTRDLAWNCIQLF
ncbi:hypothetical protein ACOSQ4_028147 [Xanthoceras sorbifolium]